MPLRRKQTVRSRISRFVNRDLPKLGRRAKRRVQELTGRRKQGRIQRMVSKLRRS